MKKKRGVYKWKIEQLWDAVKNSHSYRQVIETLGLIPAGGNYAHIKRLIAEHGLDISHFLGRAANCGPNRKGGMKYSLEDVLVQNSTYQSHKLKNKLFDAGLKEKRCEECGWAKASEDGRIPVELDHINGDRNDNRLSNLRILCPNCHSLKSTHRGRNIMPRWRNGKLATLKMS